MKLTALCIIQCVLLAAACFADSLPDPFVLESGWQWQFATNVSRPATDIAWVGLDPQEWRDATVPGTVLTSLVNNQAYPDPLYGENNRPDQIPESLCRQSYWYRIVFRLPKAFAGRRIWLHFDGINYSAEVWVNGQNVGTIHGAFERGLFDITTLVTPGRKAALAVLIAPPPHPGWPHEHTLFDGMGQTGGIATADGPVFFPTLGWDWMPAVRDRDTGIWQKVYLTASGPVVLKNPLVTADLPLPSLDPADLVIQATVENVSDKPQRGMLNINFGEGTLSTPVELKPKSSNVVTLDSKAFSQLRLPHPRLWWPNGYGPQNLYHLSMDFDMNGKVSDRQETSFGIRKITCSAPGSDNLAISVNGVRILCRGGSWGMDEAMKRDSRARLEAQIRMHQTANFTMIRNWAGQSTSEDFYQLCDKYGLLAWDEFFQPNPDDGPDPVDTHVYLANVREKILRYRNHPSIALWCPRVEGAPPKEIDEALQKLVKELDPARFYQGGATARRGVRARGPYCWRPPREFYNLDTNDIFNAETGAVSIPTLESIHGMMPQKDWEVINDDWAEHDLAKGAQHGDQYPKILSDRYGSISNLADFARKGQLANYEDFRAMYEGRNASFFKPSTGVLAWMSNPAQPSFVGQLYHYDLEPNASLFAAKKACEPLHIQLNEKTWEVEVINNLSAPVKQSHASLAVFNLDGTMAYQRQFAVEAPPVSETPLGAADFPTNLSDVHFVKLEWRNAAGGLISGNFYWRALPEHQDSLQALGTMPMVTLDAGATRRDEAGKCQVQVALTNSSPYIALMAHLQLRRMDTHDRVLPVFYSDNYVSLVPGETRTISIEAAESDLQHQAPLIMMDGWNIAVKPVASARIAVALDDEAQVAHSPASGLPVHIQ